MNKRFDQIWNDFFRFRRKVFFEKLCNKLSKPIEILDVGGTINFWENSNLLSQKTSVTVLNIVEQRPSIKVKVVIGDACNLCFKDKSFDIVFSNSVLGHVGDWRQQKKMADEIRRVGCRYFVQTPNQDFFIDWRTLMPFFHWLSPTIQAWCLQRFSVGLYRRTSSKDEAMILATRIRNVTRKELQEFFPGGEIINERVLFFTKSFMVYDGF